MSRDQADQVVSTSAASIPLWEAVGVITVNPHVINFAWIYSTRPIMLDRLDYAEGVILEQTWHARAR